MGNLLKTDEMVGLNNLPKVDTFLGMLDLKTGSMIICAICVVHPLVYGCTFFMPMSYLLLTIWILLAIFFAASIVLFIGLMNNDILLIDIWIWYTLVFIVIMLMLMFLLALVFTASKQRVKVLAVILGILWYILTVYFILVVNSHRKALINATGMTQSQDLQSDRNDPISGSSDLQSPNSPESPHPPDATDASEAIDSKDAAGPMDPVSVFRRDTDQLKALRKASAKRYSK